MAFDQAWAATSYTRAEHDHFEHLRSNEVGIPISHTRACGPYTRLRHNISHTRACGIIPGAGPAP
eukprot:3643073-Rhodomonas_salina.2